MGGATERVLGLLVEIGCTAATLLVLIVLLRLLFRGYLIEKTALAVPREQRPALRRVGWSGVLRRRPSAPADPYALTVPVMVAPEDGRPGWTVMSPGPAVSPGPESENHARQDARILLERGTYVLVQRLGRVGDVVEGMSVAPAAERVERARGHVLPHRQVLGPVDRVEMPFGEGWRTTWVWEGTGRGLTDTHVDHDGWAYIVGVLSSRHHARAVDVLDRVLATWRWLPLPVSAAEPPPW